MSVGTSEKALEDKNSTFIGNRQTDSRSTIFFIILDKESEIAQDKIFITLMKPGTLSKIQKTRDGFELLS